MSVDLRDIPSFPTRRSSDLLYNRNIVNKLVRQHKYNDVKKSYDLTKLKLKRQPLHQVRKAIKKEKNARQLPTIQENSVSSLDRKSTRLNSSHVRISYAVFCL